MGKPLDLLGGLGFTHKNSNYGFHSALDLYPRTTTKVRTVKRKTFEAKCNTCGTRIGQSETENGIHRIIINHDNRCHPERGNVYNANGRSYRK